MMRDRWNGVEEFLAPKAAVWETAVPSLATGRHAWWFHSLSMPLQPQSTPEKQGMGGRGWSGCSWKSCDDKTGPPPKRYEHHVFILISIPVSQYYVQLIPEQDKCNLLLENTCGKVNQESKIWRRVNRAGWEKGVLGQPIWIRKQVTEKVIMPFHQEKSTIMSQDLECKMQMDGRGALEWWGWHGGRGQSLWGLGAG